MLTPPQYISTSRAAERLGLSREHVRRLIQGGELRAEETVNGFMLDAKEVERFAACRQVQRDQREFRSAVNDLAIKVGHVEGATELGSVIASLRDEAKVRSAFELANAIAPQMEWMNQQVVTQAALVALREPVKAVTEQWRHLAEDANRALSASLSREDTATFKAKVNTNAYGRGQVTSSILRRVENAQTVVQQRDDNRLANMAAPLNPLTAHNREMERGFVVAESREMRLEEKVDELDRKVEQLTELVMQQRADTVTEMPTWQQWAGSERPEDVLAKLAAVRETITGGKQAGENSTDVIREARNARGGGE